MIRSRNGSAPIRGGVSIRSTPPKGEELYVKLWAVVDCAVIETFKVHPDYLTPQGRDRCRLSLNKRIVGQLAAMLRTGRG